MRRGFLIVPLLLLVLLGVGASVAAYDAGERHGTAEAVSQIQSAQANGESVQVVHVVDEGHGFFFPGFFLFPLLFFFLIIAIAKSAWRWGGGRGPGGWHGPGHWDDEGRKRFEERAREWHKQEHGETPPAPPATV
jgi:hypothetical protein